jgi:hypothetical protein
MLDADTRRSLAAAAYNECWTLLEQPERSAADDARLITLAFASLHLWEPIARPDQIATGEWMVAHAASHLGLSDVAVLFAQRAWDHAQGDQIPDWMLASAAEGLARAYRCAGRAEEYQEWVSRATDLVTAIAEDEERAIIAGQLAEIV